MGLQIRFTAGPYTVDTTEIPEVLATVISVRAERWAAGTGTTLLDYGLPLKPGQLFPANIANVSLWLGGVEYSMYPDPLGVYPDGSARTLYIQATATLTNGSPVTGEVRLTGGFTAGRLSRVDNSATWSNSNTGTAFISGGLPQGAIVPNGSPHLCASSPIAPLVPLAGQPVFTGSAAVDTAFTETFTSTVLAWDGTPGVVGPASYDRMAALYSEYCRTDDTTYLRAAFAFGARVRLVFWSTQSPVGVVAEPQQPYYNFLLMYLLRRDTDVIDWCKWRASFLDLAMRARLDEYNGRYASAHVRPLAVLIACGKGSLVSDSSARTMLQIRDNLFTEALVKSDSGLLSTNDRVLVTGFAADGTTAQRVSYAYMAGMWLDSLLFLCDVSPVGTTNRTAVLNQISASVLRLRQSPFLTTSTAGVTTLAYSDAANYFGNRTASVAAPYTSGSVSIQVTVAAWANLYLDVGSVVIIAGVSRAITAPVTMDGAGTGTLTIASGFGSSYSAGQACNVNPIAAFAPNPGNENTVDLNGFVAHLFAWRADYENSVTDANLARQLYAGLGGTPRDGSSGPFIAAQKQWDEFGHRLFLVMAHLQRAGL